MSNVREYVGVPPVSAFADIGMPSPGGTPIVINSLTGSCYVLIAGVVTLIGGTPLSTPVSLANGGTGATLTAPVSDGIFTYDVTLGSSLFIFPLDSTIINGTELRLASGTYSPTVTIVSNLDAATLSGTANYMRVGNTVTVSGAVTVDPTLAATQTELSLTLPIASNFGSGTDCRGTAFCAAIAGQGAAMFAVAATDTANMRWISGDTTSQLMSYIYTYTVI